MTVRYELLGETVVVMLADQAAALSRLVEKVRADERAECLKLVASYEKTKIAAAEGRGQCGDREGVNEAYAAAAAARVIGYLIRERAKVSNAPAPTVSTPESGEPE